MKLRKRDVVAVACEVSYAMLDAQVRYVAGTTTQREAIVESFNGTVRAILRRAVSTAVLHAAFEACEQTRSRRRKRHARVSAWRSAAQTQDPMTTRRSNNMATKKKTKQQTVAEAIEDLVFRAQCLIEATRIADGTDEERASKRWNAAHGTEQAIARLRGAQLRAPAAKPKPRRDRIERCIATVSCMGDLSISYKWAHLPCGGRHDHDEDVGTWSDDEILDLVCNVIGIEHDEDREAVEVRHE